MYNHILITNTHVCEIKAERVGQYESHIILVHIFFNDISGFMLDCLISWIVVFYMQQNLDYVDCIEKITKKLKTHKGLYNVFPITTAKVPIIKFKHRRSQLEGDISLYNLLVEIFHRFISK